MEIIMMKDLLEANEKKAQENRDYFKKNRLFAVNVMGSPGSGKTTLIEALARNMEGVKVGVIEGDIASDIDAERLVKRGIPASQINTGGECHLDSAVIRQAAEQLGLRDAVVFIENVGNLICPAEFDLGEDLRLLAASVPEGDDKPFKYVPMFSYIDVVALTKSELSAAAGFDRTHFMEGLRLVSHAQVFDISCKANRGVDQLAAYLKERFRAKVEG